jgi:transposase
MYLRKNSRRYKGQTYSNYLLVESVLTAKGPRQKTVCSLGNLSPRPREQWLELAHRLEAALVGQRELVTDPQQDTEVEDLAAKVKAKTAAKAAKAQASFAPQPSVAAEPAAERISIDPARVEVERCREAGAVHVGLEFWRRLELDKILRQVGLNERQAMLTCAMVLNRLIHPESELAMPDWIRSTALGDLQETNFEGLNEDSLYRQMDQLHPHRVPVEAGLAERERDLFHLDATLFFYDVTSTYFEGRALANPKAQRGYSRDGRPQCKQVLVGLAVNRDGFPLAHEVLAGNRHDSTTLEEMLEALDRRVKLQPGQTVVVDRGIAGEENLKKVRARQLHYLVAERQTERDQWLQEFETAEGFQPVLRAPSPRNPFQKKTTIEVLLRRVGEETHVLCLSSERKEKDRAIRESHERRLKADMEKLVKRVAKGGKRAEPKQILESIGRLKERYPRVARYYQMIYDTDAKTFRYQLDEAKREKAAKLDGSYLLKTDRTDLTADEIWRIYILLTRAETAFRNMKGPLGERPIWHHKQQRVETHIFLCVLAYHLLIAIEKTLLDQGLHTSWETVRETLRTHQVCTVVLPTGDGRVLRIRKASSPEPSHRELYQRLQVPLQLIRPKRSWSGS